MQFLTDPIWFPPGNVIFHFRKLVSERKLVSGTKLYKKAYETYITAILLVGVIKAQNREYWAQLVDDKEGSPDVRTGCYHKIYKDNDFATQDVELVKYDGNSNTGLVEFLLKTKLSKNKSYDEKTIILCHVDKTTNLSSFTDLNKKLVDLKLNKNSPVIIIGKTNPEKEVYRIVQIYPQLDLNIEFNLIEEVNNQGKKPILSLYRSAKGEIISSYKSEEKHYPFEKLGFKL